MNIKYTLFKNDDFYYLLIGTWFDANKAGFLHLKHGIFTACEMDQITRKKQAIFDFNNHFAGIFTLKIKIGVLIDS